MSRAAALAAAVLLAVLSATVAGADPDPREAYRQALEAIETKNWPEAERLLRAAIAERSQERAGLLRADYLPHYYLGVVLAARGDCRGALSSWVESERQDQVGKAKLADELARGQRRCRDHLREVETAKAEASERLTAARERARELAKLARTPELELYWQRGEPSFAARQRAAEERLATARERLETGDRGASLDRIAEARELAERARAELETLLADARRKREEASAAVASAAEDLEQTAQQARRVLAAIVDLEPYPERLGARVDAVQETLGRIATRIGGGALPDELRALDVELADAVEALERAARRPPAALRRAAEAFFAGGFEDTLEILDAENFARDRRARAHACLLRGAARHALFVLDGERDPAMLERTAEELVACSEDGDLEPSPEYFSPRFIEFRRRSLEAAAAAEAAEAAGELAEGEAGGASAPAESG